MNPIKNFPNEAVDTIPADAANTEHGSAKEELLSNGFRPYAEAATSPFASHDLKNEPGYLNP